MPAGSDQTLDLPTVLLTGASSQVGIFAIPRLLAAGFRVLAVSRKGRPQAFPEFEKVQWLNEADAMHAARNSQYLLSAGPMELAQKFLATDQKYSSVCVFSSSSVETKQQSANSEERTQMRDMLRLESALHAASQNMGFKLVILRPTLIYGCGLDSNISRLANWIRRFGFLPVNGRAAGLRQPVHADDLASVAIEALLSEQTLPVVLSVSGGDSISYSDMVARIFVALEKPVRLLRLPEWLFVMLVKAAGIFGSTAGVNSEMIKRQRLDLVFDDRQARQLLDYKPRPFAPRAADFVMPESFQKADSP